MDEDQKNVSENVVLASGPEEDPPGDSGETPTTPLGVYWDGLVDRLYVRFPTRDPQEVAEELEIPFRTFLRLLKTLQIPVLDIAPPDQEKPTWVLPRSSFVAVVEYLRAMSLENNKGIEPLTEAQAKRPLRARRKAKRAKRPRGRKPWTKRAAWLREREKKLIAIPEDWDEYDD